MSVLGDGWHLVPDGTELLVEWEQGTTPDPRCLIKAVWTVAGTHHTPIRQAAGTIVGVLAPYGNIMTPPSLRQVRNTFIQSLVWRGLHFLLRLRGRDACLLGDSSPWGDNTEITSFQLCWLDADGSLSMYPIHVTVECGKTAHVLYLSLLRQMAYWKTLSNHLVELGLLSCAQTFSFGLRCLYVHRSRLCFSLFAWDDFQTHNPFNFAFV